MAREVDQFGYYSDLRFNCIILEYTRETAVASGRDKPIWLKYQVTEEQLKKILEILDAKTSDDKPEGP